MAKRYAHPMGLKSLEPITSQQHMDFLLEYQKSILLALSEQGIIDSGQCQMCIDRLTCQIKSKPSHLQEERKGRRSFEKRRNGQ